MAEENAPAGTDAADESNSQDGNASNGRSSLVNKETLIPAATAALTAAAAGLALKKGPDLMRMINGKAEDEAEDLGRRGTQGARKGLAEGLSQAGVAGKVASKLIGGSGGGGGKGGKTRRLPIQRWTDVAVPLEEAYEKWTNFDEFPKFMHRVLEVEQEEDNKLHWREKIWFWTREWDGEIVEKRKNDRIAWKSVSGTQHSGVVSFHRLDSKLTRVLVTVDFVPTGMIEKMASGTRFVKRAIQADLARFKAYAELGRIEELDYSSNPQEMEQHRDGKSDDGDGADRDDGERESRREDRQSRRQERQKASSSS